MINQNFINGAFVDSTSGETDDVINPATGQILAKVPSSNKEDANNVVACAKAAFETWGNTTPRERSEALYALAQVVEANLDELKEIESQNVGKPISIIEFEFDLTVDNLKFFAGACRTMPTQGSGEYLEDHTSYLRREPLGVCFEYGYLEIWSSFGRW